MIGWPMPYMRAIIAPAITPAAISKCALINLEFNSANVIISDLYLQS